MRLSHIFVAVLPLSFAHDVEQRSGTSCRDILTNVTAHAQNKVLPMAFNVSDLTSRFLNQVVAGLPTTLTGGEYTIAGRYCEPARHVAKRRDTVQVLIHGLTYTVDYWSGLAPPGTKQGQNRYSWVEYASQQGYPTLSFDRLCNGKSTKANGLSECQLPLEVEVMHEVLKKVRAGTIKGVPRSFSRIIWVGHSYGSQLGNGLALQHPNDVESYILSGFTLRATVAEPGALERPLFLPAKYILPDRYGGQNDLAYTVASKYNGATTIFYSKRFSHKLSRYDFDTRGTFQAGEGATVQLGQVRAPRYAGPLLILNGNNDNIFCARTPLDTITGTPGNCEETKASENVKKFYPKASPFEFHNIPETGHCLQLHYTAHHAMKVAHDFMARLGF